MNNYLINGQSKHCGHGARCGMSHQTRPLYYLSHGTVYGAMACHRLPRIKLRLGKKEQVNIFFSPMTTSGFLDQKRILHFKGINCTYLASSKKPLRSLLEHLVLEEANQGDTHHEKSGEEMVYWWTKTRKSEHPSCHKILSREH